MLEFLQKNVEIVETFKQPTKLYKGELTYYHFKIGEHHFMLSDSGHSLVLTDFIPETKEATKYIALGSKNNIKEAIKKLVIRYGN